MTLFDAYRYDGKRVVVVGGASGMGAAAAELVRGKTDGVPAAVGRDPRLLYDHPQLQARGFYEDIDHPIVGTMPTPTLPFRFASVDRWLRTPAPTLGQHTGEILTELGYSDAAIADLRRRHVLGGPA